MPRLALANPAANDQSLSFHCIACLLLNSAPGKGTNQQDFPFHQVGQSWSHNHSHLAFLKTPVSTGGLCIIVTGSSQLSLPTWHLSPSSELGPFSPGCTVEARG